MKQNIKTNIADKNVAKTVKKLPQFSGAVPDASDGKLYRKAVRIVIRDNKPLISYLQQKLEIGYAKAADIIEKMGQDHLRSGKKPTTAMWLRVWSCRKMLHFSTRPF